MRPRIKICGVRRAFDAQLAVDLGATHIGCVLANDSPRCATPAEVREIASAVASSARMILVFRDPRGEEVTEASAETGVENVQVHGVDESYCSRLEARGLIVHRVYSLTRDATGLPELGTAPTQDCPAFLDVGLGGSGRSFDWEILGGQAPEAMFIAGGITPDNVAELLEQKPWGIDLSSGVESAPGVKDHDKLRRLFAILAEVEA